MISSTSNRTVVSGSPSVQTGKNLRGGLTYSTAAARTMASAWLTMPTLDTASRREHAYPSTDARNKAANAITGELALTTAMFTFPTYQMLFQQILLHKHDGRIELVVAIFLFAKAMTFVLGHEPPDSSAILTDDFHHLFRLAGGNSRIIFPRDDEQRLGDLFRFVARRGRLQELTPFGLPFAPIFHSTQTLTISDRLFDDR